MYSRPTHRDPRRILLITVFTLASHLLLAQQKPVPPKPEADPAGDAIIAEFKREATSDDPHVRADQMERLLLVDRADSVKLLQTYGLKDGVYSVFERAVRSLSQLKSAGARDALVAGLKDSSERVRGGSALAIAKIEDHPPALVKELLAAAAAEKQREA